MAEYGEAFYPSGDGTATSNSNVRVRCDAWAEKAESTTGKVTVYNSLQLRNIYGYSGGYMTSGTSIAAQIRANSSSSTTEVGYSLDNTITIPDWKTIVRASITVTAALNGDVTFQVSGRTYGSPTIGEFNLSWYTVTLSRVLTAVHTVSFNLGGASGTTPGNVTKKYGYAFSMPADPTWANHNFLGWKSNISGDTTLYKRSISSSGTTNGGYTHDQYGGTVTLTAQWATTTYSVTYNANGGSGAPGEQLKQPSANLTLTTTIPTRYGYTFIGWNTSQNGGGTMYQPGGTYSTNANVVLYAQWTLNTYTITYNANGGTGAPSNTIKTHGQAINLSTTTPTRAGYTFFRWNTKSDGSGEDYSPGMAYTKEQGKDLYATWIENVVPDEMLHDAYVNVSNNWKTCYAYIKIGNNWYPAKQLNVNVGGSWKNTNKRK